LARRSEISCLEIDRRLGADAVEIGGKPFIRALVAEVEEIRQESPLGVHFARAREIPDDVFGLVGDSSDGYASR
jgi:hypothetical protein